MSLRDLTSVEAVILAIEECDRLGVDAFLHLHGFSSAHRYRLHHKGGSYDSKAIAGVAYGYQHPHLGALASGEFVGGVGRYGAASVLRTLGFCVSDEGASAVSPSPTTRTTPSVIAPARRVTAIASSTPSVILLGCVKTKLTVAAPAKDLYISDLFVKRRLFAESLGCPWFILSAEHGLLAPETVLAPYDMELKSEPVAYRREWGNLVLQQLDRAMGSLLGIAVEVHAGDAYVAAVRKGLHHRGAELRLPLAGLRMGEQLAWYVTRAESTPHMSVTDAVRALSISQARSPAGFPWSQTDLDLPGLYAWHVDPSGAATLGSALGSPLQAGLVYAGQAGATRWPSGKTSNATLTSRINSQHLSGAITASTWRLTLAALLGQALSLTGHDGRLDAASSTRLTAWMNEHLSLAVHPVRDRDGLQVLEKAVLERLDPPFNLAGMPKMARRTRLTELRQRGCAAWSGGCTPVERARLSALGAGHLEVERAVGTSGSAVAVGR